MPTIPSLQEDVVAESDEILQLGLLFGEDVDATTSDLPAVLSFQHKLIQEYVAALYIAEQVQMEDPSTFLTEAFPTWEKIENHREVVLFTCGILADTDASPITQHVAKVLNEHTKSQLNGGLQMSVMIPEFFQLIASFNVEGNVSTDNPYITEYPQCSRPLVDILANTELAVITSLNENDTFQLGPCSADILLNVSRKEEGKLRRVWETLPTTHYTNINALYTTQIRTDTIPLSHFAQLKHLSIINIREGDHEDLVQSIDSWGPDPPLTYCRLRKVIIEGSLITALCKCTYLLCLNLAECNMKDKVCVLMDHPPPVLRDLNLGNGSLCASDVDHLTQAIKNDKLKNLKKLDIRCSPVGEDAVNSLLEAISTRDYSEFKDTSYV